MFDRQVSCIVQFSFLVICLILLSFESAQADECARGLPSPQFEYQTSSYSVPATVQLDGTSSNGCGSDIVQANWDLGDGTILGQTIPAEPIILEHDFILPGTYTLTLEIITADGDRSSVSHDLTLFDQFCEIYPITFEQALFDGIEAGTAFDEVPIGMGTGNFSWLTWSGDPSAPALALSLLPPGNSRDYINPDNIEDSLPEIGEWVQGSPGVSNSRNVREAVNALLGRDIIVPVWNQTREQGNAFDYLVADFALVRLNAYKLSGQGWFSFTYEGATTCYNQPPVAISNTIGVLEDDSISVELVATDIDGDSLVYTISSQPIHGVLTGDGSLFVYTPNPNFFGTDSLTFYANDGQVDSNVATVTLNVSAVNDVPIAFSQRH